MAKATITVIVPSIVLSKRKYEVLIELKELYGRMVVELVEYGFKNGVKSFTGLKRHIYRKLREKFSLLASHYVHTACQDAAIRIKSFLELRKRVEPMLRSLL